MGRPTIYTTDFNSTILELMAQGASKVEVAATIGISRDTLYRWTKEYDEFSDTIKEGELLSEAWWQRKGRENIENKGFNSTLWYMNMKNRFGWRDKPTESPQDERLEETRSMLRAILDDMGDPEDFDQESEMNKDIG